MQEKECQFCSEIYLLDVTLAKVFKFLSFGFPIGKAGRIKLNLTGLGRFELPFINCLACIQ